MDRIWKFVLREPLVHFVVLAALLFLASALWSNAGREPIQVDRATQEYLIQQRADLLLRPLTPEEEEQAVASYVEDEILLREARKRGLDRSSAIRRQLVKGMRFLLLGDPPQPSEAELRAFYEQQKARFEQPPALALDHVFFASPDESPEAILARLNSGAAPQTLGEYDTNLGKTIPPADQRQLVRMFGPEGARAILAIEDDLWHGPIDFPRGTHFVRIVERHPARMPSFEDVAPYLEGEWLLARQRQIVEGELETLRENYEIIIEPRAGSGDG